MNAVTAPARTRLVHVQSRGWLVGKLGIVVLVTAAALLIWGPLVAPRSNILTLVGWLSWGGITLLALGTVIRVAEAVWGAGCTVYFLARSVVATAAWTASAASGGLRSLVRVSRRMVAVGLIVLLAPSGAWGFASVVLDPTNLVQNTIAALKAVESVINEVQMISNQIKQIENMVQNTATYGGVWDREALPRLIRLGQIIEQEQAIAYGMAGIDRVFRERYPGYRPITDWARTYDQWTRGTLDTLRGTLASVRLQADDFADEQRRIETLTAMGDSAGGRMQAIQVGNMLAAEQLQQLAKLRQLMMTQVNAQNVYMADRTNRDAQRAATQQEWVKNGNREAPVLSTTNTSSPVGR
jgi:P-type conjugative transfer protein TrbJ